MSERKSLKKNAFYNSIKTVAAIIFPLITFPYISRTLLVEGVGKIGFASSIVGYFSLIASLGINVYAIRECAIVRDDKEKLEKLASEIFSVNLVTTVISYLLLALVLVFSSKLAQYRLLITILSLSIFFTTIGTDWINSALEDFKFITIRTVGMQFVSLVLMFVFVKCPDDYLKYAAISVLASSGANIINVFYIRKYCKIKFTFDMHFKTHIIAISFMFALILSQTIYTNVDVTMLGFLKGDASVGIYTTAQKIYNIVGQLLASILWVMMPRLSHLYGKDDFVGLNILLRRVLGFYITLGFPCVIGCVLLSKEIVLCFAGVSFENSATVLNILMIAFTVSLFGGGFLGNMVLLPCKREKYFMFVCFMTAIANIILNYFLIPKYGEFGAAFTTAICSVIMLILLLLRMDKRIHISNMKGILISSIIGCVGIYLVCNFFPSISNTYIDIIIRIVFSAIVYFAILYFIKNELVKDTVDVMFIKLKNILVNYKRKK